MIRYAWKANHRFEIPAQAVGEELERIEARDGKVNPAAVVDAARPEGSLLHPFFEWNNNKAAEAHRLEQARNLIRYVVVKSVGKVEPEQSVRAFVSLAVDTGREYLGIAQVMSDAEKRALLFHQAKTELEQWRRRYQALIEFNRIFEMIDRLDAAK